MIKFCAPVPPAGQACWEAWTASPGPRPDRRREIDTRLDAVRARLKKLREEIGTLSRAGPPHPGTGWKRPSVTRPRRTSPPPACTRGQRRHGSATCACPSGRQHSIGLLPRTGSGAERALWLLSEPGRAEPAAVSNEPRGGVAPIAGHAALRLPVTGVGRQRFVADATGDHVDADARAAVVVVPVALWWITRTGPLPSPGGGFAGRRPAGGSALGVDAVPGRHLHRPVAGCTAEDYLAQ